MKILSITLKSQYHQGLKLFTLKYLFLNSIRKSDFFVFRISTLSSKKACTCVNAIIYMESDFDRKRNRFGVTCIRFLALKLAFCNDPAEIENLNISYEQFIDFNIYDVPPAVLVESYLVRYI